MTSQEAITILCKMLGEETEQTKIQAIVKAISALSINLNYEQPLTIYKYEPITRQDVLQSNIDPCKYCSNNPKNGGSGICNCTIPYMNNATTTYETLGLEEIRC